MTRAMIVLAVAMSTATTGPALSAGSTVFKSVRCSGKWQCDPNGCICIKAETPKPDGGPFLPGLFFTR